MNRAFIIIDVQNFYFPGGDCELYHAYETLQVVKKLIEKFREKKVPIIYIQHLPEGVESAPKGSFDDIHSEIEPRQEDIVIVKHRPSSFYKTTLQEVLAKLGATELHICGMMSHMCVDTTVRAAKDLEYDVTLYDDACTTKDLVWNGVTVSAADVHNAFMSALDGTFANVIKA